jgi:hypothetical protein
MFMLRRNLEESQTSNGQNESICRCPMSRSFWDDIRNAKAAEKILFVIRQVPLMIVWCRINTLELSHCDVEGQDTGRLAGVLSQ